MPSSLVRLFGAFLPLAVMLPAQSVGDWRPIESTVVPPPRTGYSMAGSLNGATFLIGGDSANANALDYVWSGTGWTPFSTPIAPRRDNSAFALYGEHGTMLYGGSAAGAWLGDAYLMDVNGVFTQIAGPPNVLADPSLAYEADGDRMVLVGRNAQGFYETHFYSDGSGWSAGPSFAVADARVVGDTVRGEALLFTSNFGLLDVAALADDTWQYLASTPTLTALGELAFDPRRGRVVLVQPYSDRATLEWDGLRFHAVTASSGSYVPPAATAMAFDRRRGEMLYVANYGAGVETFRHVAEPGASWLAFGSSCGFYGGTIRVAAGEPVPGTWHRLEADLPAGSLALSVLGLSRTSAGGVSLPLLIQFCYLRVDPAVVTVLGTSTGTASQMIWLPNQASLLGELYDAQFLQVDGTGALVAGSPGLEVQVGATTGEQAVVESFDTEARRDPLASGDRWVAGEVAKVAIGGDGLHGSFDPALGVQVEPGVYEFSTDLMTIPADRTLSGANEQVTNGRFYFTDFVVPAGVAVRFVGSNPATVFVRGMVEVHGEVSVDAPDMPAQLVTSGPASGQRISSFQARSGPVLYTYTPGQPGGAGGAGGAPGGDGGDECQNAGPVVVNGVDVTSGQPGGDVRVAAGHAFAASVAGTGGAGSTLMPPTGVWASSVPLLQYIYCGYFSPGGGGGGFATFGGMAVAPTHNSPSLTITTGAIANGGNPFPIAITPPAGHTSLEHFSVGGAGGGGG
ncbi:MAG TPA: hypothetical protein ENI87_05055, partial [bacterium]|nr:hypothetical protein [bacterium]